MNDNQTERPFRATEYMYHVSLGTVLDKDALGWDVELYVAEWRDVEQVVSAWRNATEYPAIEVDAAYRPRDSDA